MKAAPRAFALLLTLTSTVSGLPASAQTPAPRATATLDDEEVASRTVGESTSDHGADPSDVASGGGGPRQEREYPWSEFLRYGDFWMGDGCPSDRVRVEVVTREHVSDSESFEITTTPCLPWQSLESSPSVPTVTNEFAGDVIRKKLPKPQFRMNPSSYAVTGIETWVWYGDDGALTLQPIDHDSDASTPPVWGATVTASDPVNTVTATVWISEYRWDMGDGTVIRSATPGSAGSPAGEHLYTETSEANVVTASTVWTGTWNSTAGGIANGSGTLGPVVVTGPPTDYPVYQVRSAPVGRR